MRSAFSWVRWLAFLAVTGCGPSIVLFAPVDPVDRRAAWNGTLSRGVPNDDSKVKVRVHPLSVLETPDRQGADRTVALVTLEVVNAGETTVKVGAPETTLQPTGGAARKPAHVESWGGEAAGEVAPGSSGMWRIEFDLGQATALRQLQGLELSVPVEVEGENTDVNVLLVPYRTRTFRPDYASYREPYYGSFGSYAESPYYYASGFGYSYYPPYYASYYGGYYGSFGLYAGFPYYYGGGFGYYSYPWTSSGDSCRVDGTGGTHDVGNVNHVSNVHHAGGSSYMSSANQTSGARKMSNVHHVGGASYMSSAPRTGGVRQAGNRRGVGGAYYMSNARNRGSAYYMGNVRHTGGVRGGGGARRSGGVRSGGGGHHSGGALGGCGW